MIMQLDDRTSRFLQIIADRKFFLGAQEKWDEEQTRPAALFGKGINMWSLNHRVTPHVCNLLGEMPAVTTESPEIMFIGHDHNDVRLRSSPV